MNEPGWTWDTVDIGKIIVGPRHRRDLGDVASLAKSIAAVGLLHPLVVTSDLRLVAGRRRLEAVRQLGWDKVTVSITDCFDDALAALLAERDENQQRQPLRPSEAAALGEALEELERAEAKKRKAQAKDRPRGEKAAPVSPGNLPEEKGDTRDRVAAAVGMSGKTYEKAKRVVEAAEADPTLKPVVEEMDRTGKVDPAYRMIHPKVEGFVQGPTAAGARIEGPSIGGATKADPSEAATKARYTAWGPDLIEAARRFGILGSAAREEAGRRGAHRDPRRVLQLVEDGRRAVDLLERIARRQEASQEGS
jgi:hypothetical protein